MLLRFLLKQMLTRLPAGNTLVLALCRRAHAFLADFLKKEGADQ